MLQLTTLNLVLTYMGAPVADDGVTIDTSQWSVGDQQVITSMIGHVSAAFENYCSRAFTIGTYTVNALLAGRAVYVDQYPVQSVSSVLVSRCGRSQYLSAWSDWEIGPDNDCIIIFGAPEESLVQATFVGGLAADTNDVIANFPDLNGICNLQVATLWRRHNTADRHGMSLGTGTTSWNKEYKLLDDVADTLDQYYRAAHNIF